MLMLLGPLAALSPIRWPWLIAIAIALPLLGNAMLYWGGQPQRLDNIVMSIAVSAAMTGAAYALRLYLARRKNRTDHAA